MKIFAQLINTVSGERSPPFSGSRQELARIFRDEMLTRFASDDADIRSSAVELAVLVLVDNADLPDQFMFSQCPVMSVKLFFDVCCGSPDVDDSALCDRRLSSFDELAARI
jgi:hypothetical protein